MNERINQEIIPIQTKIVKQMQFRVFTISFIAHSPATKTTAANYLLRIEKTIRIIQLTIKKTFMQLIRVADEELGSCSPIILKPKLPYTQRSKECHHRIPRESPTDH